MTSINKTLTTIFILIILLIFCFTGCISKETKENNASSLHSSQVNVETKNIKTKYFEVDIPTTYVTDVNYNGDIVLKKDDEIVGEIQLMGYDSEKSGNIDFILDDLLGNNETMTNTKELLGYFTKTYEVTLERSSPAAASIQNSQIEKHIIFITQNYFEKTSTYIAYDIYIISPTLSDDTLINMAKSFKEVKN